MCKLVPMATLLPIYMYHHIRSISEPAYEPHLCLPPDVLRAQILWFKAAGYSFLTLKQAWDRISSGDSRPPAVCLTFDDVDQEFMRNALPILDEEQVRTTLFVIAGSLSGVELHNISTDTLPLPPCRLRSMVEKGHEIGSHGLTHRRLPGLEDADLCSELEGSRRLLENVIGVSIDSLAYPQGGFDGDVVESAKRAGYGRACTTLRGNRHDRSDQYRLCRIRMSHRHIGVRLRHTTTPLYHRWTRRRRQRDRLRIGEGGTRA